MLVSDRQTVSLLELDPDMGLLLSDDRLARARHEIRVGVHVVETGPWEVEKLSGTAPDHIGLLVVDGVLAREVLVSDTVSTELLGPGDVVRPWHLHQTESLLRHSVRWNVLARSRIALLDRRVAAQMSTFPELIAAVIDRINERAMRLTVTQAISQLNRVDRRLLALFWHMAERWGRMTPDGVALPMTLSHRMLGQLVGARRPTVSTALSELVKEGEITRRDDGTWLLTGSPFGMPAPELQRVVPMRRHLLPSVPPSSRELAPVVALRPLQDVELQPVRVNAVELQAVVNRLREQTRQGAAEMHAAFAMTTQLTARSNELRALCHQTRSRGRAATA
jgi:CRP/FNR family transcriptional regulator, cyclic AMP receptor protein